MKRINLSIMALLACSNLAMAGGDIAPISYYETGDFQVAKEVYVEPVYVAPAEPVYIAPAEPVYIAPAEPVYVAPAEPVYVAPAEPVYIAPAQPVLVPAPIVKAPKPAPIPERASVSGMYAGLGIVAARYDTNCASTGAKAPVDKTVGVMGRVGYDFNKYVGVEARAMISSLKGNGGKVKHVGAFVKPMVPLSDAVNAYGLVGIAKTTTRGSLRHANVTGLAFGGGLEYDVSSDHEKNARYGREFDGKGDQEKGLGVFADYERLYYKKGSPDLDAISAGVTYDF